VKRKLTGDHCFCSVCGEYFNSTRAFDKHRVGSWLTRRCRTPGEMLEVGMVTSSTDWWITGKHSHSTISRKRRSGDRPDPL
jgi:hypothetical protein